MSITVTSDDMSIVACDTIELPVPVEKKIRKRKDGLKRNSDGYIVAESTTCWEHILINGEFSWPKIDVPLPAIPQIFNESSVEKQQERIFFPAELPKTIAR